MHFGQTLRRAIYPPWKDKYIDYDKLKKLLGEGARSDQGSPAGSRDEDDDVWTEKQEGDFVEELVNVQLEKVHSFHSETYEKLRERLTSCEGRLDKLVVPVEGGEQKQGKEDGDKDKDTDGKAEVSDEEREKILNEVLKDLDGISEEINQLEKYSRVCYTGFLKAAKKHDRKYGKQYRVRPYLQVRLAELPFNKEDYSPLLFRMSGMYSFARQSLEGKPQRNMSFSDHQTSGEQYTSHKFWVHPDNLLEVKTVILRRLPVLVYNPQTSKIAEGNQRDPTLTSIYFDNPKFSLYTNKVDHNPDAASLRLRWYGQLSEQPEILLEKKTIKDGDASEEQRFPIKEKYIEPFLRGEYSMEKTIQKLKDRDGEDSNRVKEMQKSVDDIHSFIKENELQPVLRANYTRTAFQVPGDDRIRISLDTNLALIREDAIDTDRPCRDPDDWHRKDIDDNDMEYPFSGIRKGEINRFPFALLEIKIKGRKRYEWISDLMHSHLVKEAPRFSKFVHGVATLFEDQVNTFPFWLSLVETDIRRDPHRAFQEEQERRQKVAEDEFAVGSLLRSSPFSRSVPRFDRGKASPVGSPMAQTGPSDKPSPTPHTPGSQLAEITRRASQVPPTQLENVAEEEDSDDDGAQGNRTAPGGGTENPIMPLNLRSLFPSFSTSKYARAHRERSNLPPGVEKPKYWIKDEGPVRVEAKVWLANQRTFIKWQHVSVLLASLSLGLYNAAGQTNNIARSLAVVYTVVALFTGLWGWAMYVYRSRLIERRSGKDFDNVFGPLVVCVGLAVALVLNFGFKYHAIKNGKTEQNTTMLEFGNQTGGLVGLMRDDL